jgi:cytochrome c oxidase subunit 2
MLALSLCVAVVLAVACEGPQSALSPAGRDAARIAELFWWMAGGAAAIWLAVMGVAIYAMAIPRRHPHHVGRLFVLTGGAVLPTIVLAALLTYGLSLMPALLAPGAADGEQIEVVGEQWWWRVRYVLPDGAAIDLANELHLAVDRRVSLSLEAADVIHSLWVPSLAGKVDMIPGHVNAMALEPTRPGIYRGACAEFCGGSHAWMSLHVVVGSEEEHAAWLAAQRAPARSAEGAIAQRGETLFATLGCGACHTIRGTAADGAVGPDLTHVGSRVSLGAGTLDNDVDGFARWLAHTDELKPGVHMPSFEMLPQSDLHALATYLEGLR